MSITLLSQRDKRWANTKLGSSNLTVGADGCLETALCMFSQYCGKVVSPGLVAEDHTCFSKDGFYLWNYPDFPFILEKSLQGRNDAEIVKSLKDPQRGVVLQVDDGDHFVLALSKSLIGSYKVADPWFGDTCDAVRRWKNITGSRHLLIKKNS